MDESTLVLVSFIKDIMIIISLVILIIFLIAVAIAAIKLIGPIKSLKKTAQNLEEASGALLTSTQEVSKALGFLGSINRAVERVRERIKSRQE